MKLSAINGAVLMVLGLSVPATVRAQRVGGQGYKATRVYEDTTDVYRIRFYGHRPARVWAVGDGDIDIAVYDANGNLIATDFDDDSRPECAWTPRWTGTFTVRVINNAGYDVDYVLRTN